MFCLIARTPVIVSLSLPSRTKCSLPSARCPPSISHNWLAITFCSDRKCALPSSSPSPTSSPPSDSPRSLSRYLSPSYRGRDSQIYYDSSSVFAFVRSYFTHRARARLLGKLAGGCAREACVSFECLPSFPPSAAPPPEAADCGVSPSFLPSFRGATYSKV